MSEILQTDQGERKKSKNIEIIESLLVNWSESKTTKERNYEDYKFASELIEAVIFDETDQSNLAIVVNDSLLYPCIIGGSHGSFLWVYPKKDPVEKDEKIIINELRVGTSQLGTNGKRFDTYYVGTTDNYVSLDNLADALSRGANLIYE